jgi:DNA-binding NtrC family response regulator
VSPADPVPESSSVGASADARKQSSLSLRAREGPVALCIADEDLRLLLRGLLRLREHSVDIETAELDAVERMLPDSEPVTLLTDCISSDPFWFEKLAGILRTHPTLRTVLLARQDDTDSTSRACRLGVLLVLCRPLTFQKVDQLLEVLGLPRGPD